MRCPRKYCEGTLFIDEDEFSKTTFVCNLCSRSFTREELAEGIKEPDMSKDLDVHKRHLFIEEHKSEIIIDYLTLGTNATLDKWGLSVSGWRQIKKRWADDIKAAQQELPAEKSIRVPTVGDKRRTGYKAEGWAEPVMSREYAELKARYDGYRQAVLDIFGKNDVVSKTQQGVE